MYVFCAYNWNSTDNDDDLGHFMLTHPTQWLKKKRNQRTTGLVVRTHVYTHACTYKSVVQL